MDLTGRNSVPFRRRYSATRLTPGSHWLSIRNRFGCSSGKLPFNRCGAATMPLLAYVDLSPFLCGGNVLALAVILLIATGAQNRRPWFLLATAIPSLLF